MSTTNGREQVFNEGIKNNDARPADTTATHLVTINTDGTHGKIDPDDLGFANTDDVINTSSEPQTKIGGFTSGGINRTYASDIWLAFGTSVTFNNTYTLYASDQLNVTLTNYGVSGSTSADLVNHYSEIPTLNIGNANTYRMLSFEYSINDANTSVPLATFRANLLAGIANAKSKNWPDNKILIINGNYCSSSPLNTTLLPYANEAILIAKEQGIQYYDSYNYTKNNGYGTVAGLLNVDGIHPTATGGVVYARGLVASLNGGGEFSTGLSVINGINASSLNINLGTTTPNSNVFRVVGDADINGIFKGSSILPFTPNVSILGNASNYFLSAFIQNGNITSVFSNAVRTNIMRSGSATGTDYTNTAGTVIVSKMFDNGHWVIQNGSSYTDAGYLLDIIGTNAFRANDINIRISPSTSAGTYDILTRNTSTGQVEKITSASVQTAITATTSADYYRGDKTFQPLNKTAVGLSNVDNTSDANKPVSTATQTALNLKANLSSPSLTGTPTAPTATSGTNTTQLATTAFVQDAVAASSADIQDIVDATTKTALIDGGNSQITMFDGSTDNRTFSGLVSDGSGTSSDFSFENTNAFIRNETPTSSGLIGVNSGLPRMLRTKSGQTTEIGIDDPIAGTTINFPALVAGSYTVSVAKAYTYSGTSDKTSAELTTDYPDALPMDKVYAMSATSGPYIYEKTTTGWATILVSVP